MTVQDSYRACVSEFVVAVTSPSYGSLSRPRVRSCRFRRVRQYCRRPIVLSVHFRFSWLLAHFTYGRVVLLTLIHQPGLVIMRIVMNVGYELDVLTSSMTSSPNCLLSLSILPLYPCPGPSFPFPTLNHNADRVSSILRNFGQNLSFLFIEV